MFETIGVYPAQTFFTVDRNSGSIRTVRSLKEDGLGRERYTLRMIVYDSADSRLQDTADVTIFVTRNPSVPQWSEVRYTRTVSEDFPLGDDLLTILATDNDGVSFFLYFFKHTEQKVSMSELYTYCLYFVCFFLKIMRAGISVTLMFQKFYPLVNLYNICNLLLLLRFGLNLARPNISGPVECVHEKTVIDIHVCTELLLSWAFCAH